MIAFELGFGGVRHEAKALSRSVDRGILRRKLKVAKMVRVAYRMAKGVQARPMKAMWSVRTSKR